MDALLSQASLSLEGMRELPMGAQVAAVSAATIFGYTCMDGITTSKRLWGTALGYPTIPARAHVRGDDELGQRDAAYVLINRGVLTVAYLLHSVQYFRSEAAAAVAWPLCAADHWQCWASSLLQCAVLFALYDLFYVPWHRLLHVPAIYPWVHKHHHQQVVCFRGTFDGINTHPIEFGIGVYLHLVAVIFLQHCLAAVSPLPHVLPLQGTALLLFYLLSSLAASLNHTRFAVKVPGCYDVQDHDVHHRLPRSNYGQYVMWWDRLYGSFRRYEDSYEDTKPKGS